MSAATSSSPAQDTEFTMDTEMTVDVPVGKDAKKLRSFTISEVHKDGKDGESLDIEGKRRYLSKNPAGAAKKAASRVFREVFGKNDNDCIIYIIIRETTKNGKKEEYKYTATRSLAKDKRSYTFPGMEEKAQEGGAKSGIVWRYNVRLISDRDVAPKTKKRASADNQPTTEVTEAVES